MMKTPEPRARALRKAALLKWGSLLAGVILLLSVTVPGRIFWREAYRAVGFSRAVSAPLEIHFLNVGKADAALICCDGHLALLDAGTFLNGETVSDYAARNHLGSHLDFAVISHPDSDHMDGMISALQDFSCGELIRGTAFPPAYETLAQEAGRQGLPIRTVTVGDTWTLGDAVLEVLGPTEYYTDTNDASLVIRLTYQGLSVLFCGDMEKKAEKALLENGTNLSADVLKVAHHGSNSSSTDAFLAAVAPKAVVISTGPDRNHLPREEALIRLEAHSEELYRTDVDGTVILTYGEDRLQFRTEREGYGT